MSGDAPATRYIGSKARLAGSILDLVGQPSGEGVFVDALAGTGVVAREAASRGWPVRVNDHLLSSSRLALANVLACDHVQFAKLGGYPEAIELLNDAPPRHGFINREYSPVSAAHAGVERRYFTEANAAKIDGVRHRIGEWVTAGAVTYMEEALLVADLLVAASRVANTAGTYGCFLRHWQKSALAGLTLESRPLLPVDVGVEVLTRDVEEVPAGPQDVAYFDPPYTKRQYAAYYHVLETIAHGDEPEVGGVTGLRPWRDWASDFCYRRRALSAIVRVLTRTSARRTYLSYSSEGHVDLDELSSALSPHGSVTVHRLGEIGRYAPNESARENGSSVTEFLIELVKGESNE